MMTLEDEPLPPEPAAHLGTLRVPTFAEVYEAEFSFVWRCAIRLGAPPASLDDVVQEAFVIIHRRLPTFEGRSSLRTWLFGIVANVVRAHRRTSYERNRDHEREKLDDVVDGAEGPFEIATRAEAAALLNRILGELDDSKREVFVLAELEQMSAPEISQALGVPLNTVYSRLRLAREEFAAASARLRARDEWRTR